MVSRRTTRKDLLSGYEALSKENSSRCANAGASRLSSRPQEPPGFTFLPDSARRVRAEGRSFATTKVPIRRADGSCLLAGFAVDVTKQRRVEEEKARLREQLRQAQKMEAIGTLAGGIAHDLNNIFTPIMVYADIALLQLPTGDPVRAAASARPTPAFEAIPSCPRPPPNEHLRG